MRAFTLESIIDLPKMTPGRRRLALERVRPIAVELALGDIVTAIDAAILLEDRALTLAMLWDKTTEDHAKHEDGAMQMDAIVDRALSGLHDSIDLKVRAFDEAKSALARGLLETFFPKGVSAITSLPYVDENAAVTNILALIGQPPHRESIIALRLEDWVDRLREVNDSYGKLLTRPERLTYAQVLAADKAGFVAMLSVVARILGAYPDESDSDIANRRKLLLPITDQQDEMASLRARRRIETESAPEASPAADAGKQETVGEPSANGAGEHPS